MESCYSSWLSLRREVGAVALMLILAVVMASSNSSMEAEEKNGLLLLKAALEFASNSSSNGGICLSDNYWNNMDDCCSWEGVVCSKLLNNTTRVTQLWLNFTRCFSDPNDISYAPSYLNASLFLPFEELQLLDLSFNHLTGLNGTLRLKKLQTLHLGGNELDHVPNLAELPSLKELGLSSNPLKNLLPLQGLKLEVLDLGGISVSDQPEYNISIIWEITSLKALSLMANSLNSWPQGLCGLVNLEELDVSGNAFHSHLPPCLMNMTSLRALELTGCDFQGTIPYDFFSRLTSLEFISLSYNSFQGSLSLASFGNTSKLEVFQLKDNKHQLSIETENPLYSPPLPQLKSLRISNCLLNKPNGVFPSFLLTQSELIELELSHCGVQGVFPNWLLENNTHLWYLDLTDNSISGNLNFSYNSSSTPTPDLWLFDVSSNLIEGTLPSNIFSIFPNLEFLNMSNNMLQGSIPSLGESAYLVVLDLSSNNFTGELPGTFFDGLAITSLVKLSDNNLSGKLPTLSGNVDSIYLDGNNFTGDVSSLLLNNSNLETLDISNNRLSGIISGEQVPSLNLRYLVLWNNDLKGSLPLSFCKLENLVFLDLSGNDIGPEMPPCTNLSYVEHLHLQRTNLRGLFPKFLQGASSLVTLDLRGNAMSGGVPSWVGTLSNLRVLVLQGNNFSGSIPQKICHLNRLSILDLSVNHFSGGIPSCLNNLTFGKREDSLGSLDTSSGSSSGDSGYYYGKLSLATNPIAIIIDDSENFEAVNFLSKYRLETYKGTVLEYMSGLDLSSNNLSGTIPPEIGWLTQLHALNLSNNHLTGSIPITFRNLEEIESLDLSYNTLNGEIPPQLTELFGLSVFSVAHNNLSGRTPERKNQFSTFDQTSYEGNPLLCGMPLESCASLEEDTQPKSADDSETEVNPFKDVFWWSSAGAYLVAFIVTIFVLYQNNYYNSPGILGR